MASVCQHKSPAGRQSQFLCLASPTPFWLCFARVVQVLSSFCEDFFQRSSPEVPFSLEPCWHPASCPCPGHLPGMAWDGTWQRDPVSLSLPNGSDGIATGTWHIEDSRAHFLSSFLVVIIGLVKPYLWPLEVQDPGGTCSVFAFKVTAQNMKLVRRTSEVSCWN